MSLRFETFVLGPIDNNAYLLWDESTRQAGIIDPSFEPFPLIEFIHKEKLILQDIWLTHGHFDHFIGILDIQKEFGESIPVYIHREDRNLYLDGGLGKELGFGVPVFPEPAGFLVDGQEIFVGANALQVLHTPGHSAGHMCFYSEEHQSIFTGDLLFKQNVGRTDLPGADQDALLKSIYTKILTLPIETQIFPGHGESTTIDEEIEFNPYLN